jgi:nitrite reductase/ring-hydroxylating ferredoxin subunit
MTRFLTASVLFFTLLLDGCSSEMSDDPIPYVPFTPIVLNLSLPSYTSLQTSGFIYVDGGVRGILIYKNGSSYIAYERNCSFQPNDACATVDMHSSTLYMEDPCCNSTFTPSTGQPASGPAWRPLRKYATSLSGNELTITDEIVE